MSLAVGGELERAGRQGAPSSLNLSPLGGEEKERGVPAGHATTPHRRGARPYAPLVSGRRMCRPDIETIGRRGSPPVDGLIRRG